MNDPLVVILITVVLIMLRRAPLTASLLSLAAAGNVALALWFFPALGAIQQGPIAHAAELARDQSGPYVMWGSNTPSYSVHSGHVQEKRYPQSGDLVFTRASKLDQMPPYDVIMNERGYALVRIKP